MDIHITIYLVKNPMKTYILYASLEIAENPRNRHYDNPLYFGKNPIKTFIFICIFGDSRKSKKSAL